MKILTRPHYGVYSYSKYVKHCKNAFCSMSQSACHVPHAPPRGNKQKVYVTYKLCYITAHHC